MEAPPHAPRRRRPGARLLLAASAMALALHALLLSGGEAGVDEAMAVPAAVLVRTLEPALPMPVNVAAQAPVETPSAAPRAPKRRLPVAAPAGPIADAIAAAPVVATTQLETPSTPPMESAAPADVSEHIVKTAAKPAATTITPTAAEDPPEAIPVYRTKLPPPTTLRYEMRRGMFSGRGDLSWRSAGERYETRLQAEVAGVHVLTETSTGRIDAHGIAPARYTDQRPRRGTQAANFQRDKGRITYSGPQVVHPLPPGTQDRVSWMVQIGAVLNAEPQHAAPGGRIVFFVSGAHGDADAWAFRYVGAETVSSGLGAIHAVRFTREPRKTYDKQVDVWLAPAHQYLPVRARFTATANGEVFELLLRDIQTP